MAWTFVGIIIGLAGIIATILLARNSMKVNQEQHNSANSKQAVNIQQGDDKG